MAQIDRFMIAPIKSGLQTDLKSWIIPDDAFESLTDCYVFRGRVRKRFGAQLMNQSVAGDISQLYSRLRINIGNTPGPLNIPGTATQLAIGQAFSVGNDIFTIYQLGAAALTLSTNVAATATINSVANPNTVTFTGEPGGTAVYYYPATPVMGFVTYESDMLNDEPVFAFDQQFAYQYTAGAWQRLAAENQPGAATWTGNNSQFMWGYTYRGIFNSNYYLFVTNFNFPTANPVNTNNDYQRYWDGTAWNFFYPVLNGTFRLISSRLIVPFKNRLICLNTVENNEGVSVGTTTVTTGNFTTVIGGYAYTPGQTFVVGSVVYTIISDTGGAQPMLVTVINSQKQPPTATFDVSTGTIVITGNGYDPIPTIVYYLANPTPTSSTAIQHVNRCRFSQAGNPVNANSWLDTLGTRGGFIDAPTKEQIVSCEFLKDRLIVYFERSTWELVYYGNDVQPFRWQQLNTELGAEATFSTVPFDKVVLGIGNVGVHACNGSNVERVDDKIPDQVFEIENSNNGVYRVYGIRDYYVEMVYWTFPSDSLGTTFPNRVLVYNYKTGSWAFNIDSITAFGYYQQQSTTTWATSMFTWEESYTLWRSGTLQSNFRQVIAGNQEGFTFVVLPDSSVNSASLQITNISISGATITLTVINHNLNSSNTVLDYIYVEYCEGITGLNDEIYSIYAFPDSNTITIIVPGVSGIYTGGGTITRVSNIDIKTKQYNFYVQDGRNAFINKVDFYVDNSITGQVTVDYSVSASTESLIEQGTDTGSFLGTGALETGPYVTQPIRQEITQARLWHPIYPLAEGEVIQLHIYMNNEQMLDPFIVWADFQMHAMTFYTSPTGRLQ